jgi:hypothetical protein
MSLNDHVANLSGESTSTAQKLAVGNDAAADARPQRHHHEVRDPVSGAPLVFGERRTVRVVLAEHARVREGFAQLSSKVRTRGGLEIRRVRQMPVAAHHAREAHPDRHSRGIERLTIAEFKDLLNQHLGGRFTRTKSLVVGRLRFHLAHNASVTSHHERQRFGAADVNTYGNVTHSRPPLEL